LPNYRRIKIAGGCFFFTLCLAKRLATTLVDHIADLQTAWRWTQARLPFSSPSSAISRPPLRPAPLHRDGAFQAGNAPYGAERIAMEQVTLQDFSFKFEGGGIIQ
jgi:hypothetical protein